MSESAALFLFDRSVLEAASEGDTTSGEGPLLEETLEKKTLGGSTFVAEEMLRKDTPKEEALERGMPGEKSPREGTLEDETSTRSEEKASKEETSGEELPTS